MQLSNMYRPWAVDDGQWGIEITQGRFEGAVIQIEKVDFDETKEGEMQVDYHIINLPEGMLKEEMESRDFIDIMQLVMSDILAQAIENYKEENGN